MNKENIRLLVAAAMGTVSGLLLGMLIWGGEEKKGKLSKHLSSLSDIVRELEELDSIRAYDAAKASGGEVVPFEQAVREIESYSMY